MRALSSVLVIWVGKDEERIFTVKKKYIFEHGFVCKGEKETLTRCCSARKLIFIILLSFG